MAGPVQGPRLLWSTRDSQAAAAQNSRLSEKSLKVTLQDCGVIDGSVIGSPGLTSLTRFD